METLQPYRAEEHLAVQRRLEMKLYSANQEISTLNEEIVELKARRLRRNRSRLLVGIFLACFAATTSIVMLAGSSTVAAIVIPACVSIGIFALVELGRLHNDG